MQAGTAFWHLVNFALPALITGGATALLGRWLQRRWAGRPGFWRSWAIIGAAGLGAATAALLIFGRDGTIAGYAGVVFACALTFAWLDRGRVG